MEETGKKKDIVFFSACVKKFSAKKKKLRNSPFRVFPRVCESIAS
jgi:hypothetical protein